MINASGIFLHPWVIPYGLLAVGVVAAYARFLSELPDRTRRLVILGGAVYVIGALGCEMAGSWWVDTIGKGVMSRGLATVEEVLEMSGAIVLAYAFADYIEKHLTGLHVKVSDGNRRVASP